MQNIFRLARTASALAFALFLGAQALADNIEVLVVGGGGGGCNAGGGGGGVQYEASFSVTLDAPYSIVVGAGGAGAQNNLSGPRASSGSSSSFGSITAYGGGGGGNTGNSGNATGASGGSGGGGGAYSEATTSGGAGSQGYGGGGNGGYGGTPHPAGGGGGGSGAGGNATSTSTAGVGGPGYSSSISGSAQGYAGGGGGATYHSGTPGAGGSGGGGNGANGANGQHGVANTGGGGGGASADYTGGNGGAGIVIVRYAGVPRAIGGNITTGGGYTTHTFTSNDTFTMGSAAISTVDIDLLVVGGGGGGSSGGGGGGGIQTQSSYIRVVGVPYSVVVGTGGAAAQVNGSLPPASNGGNSSFGSIIAYGGGGGGNAGASGNTAGASGGSGGGGGAYSGATTSGGAGSQGYGGGGNGGYVGAPYPAGGGGGGSGAGGSGASASVSGAGGPGYASSISGSAQNYAGGGGGASNYSGTSGSGGSGGGGNGENGSNGQNGVVNTGGGGGGANVGYVGGTGGTGIVVVRYAGVPRATGGTITIGGGYTVHTFTSSGTFTLTSFTDTDHDGLSDDWEITYFGDLSHDGTADSDSDGLTDFDEAIEGTDPTAPDTDGDSLTDLADPYPTDYYNNETPTLSMLGGDNQTAAPGSFNANVFDVSVWNAMATAPLVDAPVTFTVTSGGGKVAETTSSTLLNSLTLFSDIDGTVQAHFKHPNVPLASSAVTVTAGTAQIVLHATASDVDGDSDGMLDSWEFTHFGSNSHAPAEDFDGDGLTNLQEYTLGTNPTLADTDGDGVADGTELTLGLDPLVAENVPATISGLRLYLKADAGMSLDGSGNVSTWADQSGNGYDATQSDPARRPQRVASGINSRPLVRFNGSSNALTFAANFMSGATAGEYFIVLKGSSSAGSVLFSDIGPGSIVYPSGTNAITDSVGASAAYAFGAGGLDLTEPRLYNVRSASGNWTASLDGNALYSASSNTVSFASGLFTPTMGATHGGAYYALSNWFSGDVAEIIFYDHVLSSADRQFIAAYLTSKYDLDISSPVAPTSLAATPLSADKVALSWTGAAGQSYIVERATGGGAWVAVVTLDGNTSYTDTGLSAVTTYSYRVKASNYAGGSTYAGPVSATTLVAGQASELPTGGLRLWLRPEELALSSGGLATWTDQSGHGNHATQATSANRPQVVAGALNGQPVARFNGSSSYLGFASNFMNGATAAEYFVVLKGSTSAGSSLFSYVSSGGTTYPSGSDQISDSIGSSANRVFSAGGMDLTQSHVYSVRAGAGLWSATLDGTSLSASTSNTVDFTNHPNFSPYLGAARGGSFFAFSNFFNGDIAEIIFYDRVLSDAEREAVNFYLNQRYDFSDQSFTDFSDFNYDSDRDGLSNAEEVILGTNSYKRDTDGDGIPDDWEVANGLDPLDPSDGTAHLQQFYEDTGPTGATVKLKVFQPSLR